MLNKSEEEILKVMKDKEYLDCLGIKSSDVEKIIKNAFKEFGELKEELKVAHNNREKFQNLCSRLGGHNEYFKAQYPDYKYFDLNYKSLLVTVKEEIDSHNYVAQNTEIYIYPDIYKATIDPMCIIDFDKEINFDEINQKLNVEISEEVL